LAFSSALLAFVVLVNFSVLGGAIVIYLIL
jgi:hypothetical protein